ncbi:hypothetical protein [Agrobacterium sp. a22-2]|uniref:hypothetical protein n=1 Tax=Agrobacterium sp. a22-2 TaxID=2283840 RepID=UPI001FEFA987|nr:hypothetical protein [Agrobacterium sp. a22-2]
MINVDEIEHDQKSVISRQDDCMFAIVIGVLKMDDSELGFAKGPDYQRPCGINPKTRHNSLTDRQRFTHMCLDHPGWGLYSRTDEMPRFKISYTGFKRPS